MAKTVKASILLTKEETDVLSKIEWITIRPGVQEKKYRRFKQVRRFCQDCSEKNPMEIIIHNSLFEGCVPEGGIICPECLEKRMGRELSVHDLEPCGITRFIMYGYNLRKQEEERGVM